MTSILFNVWLRFPSATVALRAAGLRTTGHIPESLLLEGRGRLDDTVLSNSLGDYSPDLYKERIKVSGPFY